MDEQRAKRITNALNRKPGLVVLRVRGGGAGTTVTVFGHPLLAGHVREYPAEPDSNSASLLQAIDLAVREGMALVLDYQPGVKR